MSNTFFRPAGSCVRMAAALLLSLFAAVAVAEPVHVLVQLPAGAKAPAGYAEQLAAWRQSGQVAGALMLDQNQKDNAGFASLVLLEFPSEGSYDAWAREGAPKLVAPLQVTRADVLIHGELTPRDSTKSTFLVIEYEPLVSRADYRKYVEAYIKPNMENQRANKILIRYTMFHALDEAGRKGKSWLVQEYRDAVAFGRRDAVKEAYAKQLIASNPTWKKYNDTKATIRTGGPETLAINIELPPPQLSNLPSYKPDVKVVGGLRIVGSELKNAVPQLAAGFNMFHPEAKITTSHIPSSEGGIAGLYFDVSDVAPMGDDAKITDMMPFHNTFGYMPTEISVATGGYEKRGSLFAWAIVVNKDNPLNEISVDELERVFGAERSGGWELVNNNYLFTSKYARGPETNIRTWGQLGLKGADAKREIETFGYAAPGFATAIERHWFHWSKKWNPNFKEYVETKQTTPDEAGRAVSSERPLEALAKNKHAMGIAALMHAKNYPHLKVLKISPRKGATAIALTPDNVANRTYPLIRDAFFYINKPPKGQLDPKVREFMRFVLSREGQEIIARVGYYYPLSAEYLQEQLKKLD